MLIAQLKDDNVISNNMMHLGNKLPLTFSSYCFLIQVTYRFTVSTESKQCLHQANKISHTHTHLNDANIISDYMTHFDKKLLLTFSSYSFLIQLTFRFTVSTESKQCLHQGSKISHTHTHTSTTLI